VAVIIAVVWLFMTIKIILSRLPKQDGWVEWLFSSRGDKSFGYAPIFLAQDFNYEKTNAECDPQELININHRGQAFKKALQILKNRY
jgi:inosine/xanthosine triphosphate pyrophosphatase family protein